MSTYVTTVHMRRAAILARPTGSKLCSRRRLSLTCGVGKNARFIISETDGQARTETPGHSGLKVTNILGTLI